VSRVRVSNGSRHRRLRLVRLPRPSSLSPPSLSPLTSPNVQDDCGFEQRARCRLLTRPSSTRSISLSRHMLFLNVLTNVQIAGNVPQDCPTRQTASEVPGREGRGKRKFGHGAATPASLNIPQCQFFRGTQLLELLPSSGVSPRSKSSRRPWWGHVG
jgi:hypothetical protein